MVLAERERNLERLGIAAIKPPPDFWEKLVQRPAVNDLPRHARPALEKTLPAGNLDYKVVRREAGMGSLGQQRFVAIADWEGGYREGKATVPSACVWLAGNVSGRQRNYKKAIRGAVRSPDPFQMIVGDWLVRRLSPDSNPIGIDDLPEERDEAALGHAMGSEAANVHLGSTRPAKIVKDLRRRKSNWLRSAAKPWQRPWNQGGTNIGSPERNRAGLLAEPTCGVSACVRSAR
jgi:hypothetical protein